MKQADGNYRRTGGNGAALYVTVAAAFMVIAIIAAMGLFFKITEISVSGETRYTKAEIIAAAQIELDDSIFFVGSRGAEIRIKSQLPYVDSVRITLSLPGKVLIEVTESRVAASFEFGGKTYLVDENCRILEETAGGDEAEIRGVQAISPEVGKTLDLGSTETVRLKYLQDTLAALAANGMTEDVEWIDVSNLSAVTFRYRGYEVNLTVAEDLEGKFNTLRDFLADHTGDGNGSRIIFNEDNSLNYRPNG